MQPWESLPSGPSGTSAFGFAWAILMDGYTSGRMSGSRPAILDTSRYVVVDSVSPSGPTSSLPTGSRTSRSAGVSSRVVFPCASVEFLLLSAARCAAARARAALTSSG